MADWYVRKGGSDSNGGSSASLSAERSGSDMAVTNGSTQVTSSSAAFVGGDVGKGINVAGVLYRIATVTNSTTVQLDRNYSATTGSGKAWAIGGALLTVGKAAGIAVTTVIQAGDTIWVGAGVYRECLALAAVFATTPVVLAGDVDGVKTGDPGEVRVTAFTTNDKSAPAAAPVLDLASASQWSIRNVVFIGGAGNPKLIKSTDAANITLTDCAFLGLGPNAANSSSIAFTTASARNILIDRCTYLAINQLQITTARSASADYDTNIVIRNSVIDIGGAALNFNTQGASSLKPGGILIRNCLVRGASPVIQTAAGISTTYPVKVSDSVIVSQASGTGLSAANTFQIIEDHNLIFAYTPYANTDPGTGTISNGSYAPLIHFGQERVFGARTRPWGSPAAGSPLLGFGASAAAIATDITGAARPSGGASSAWAVGPMERANCWGRETTTTHTGATALSIVGPGYQDFEVPVNAAETTVSVWLRYDSTYAGTRPQLQILGGSECGVADQSVTATTGALNAYEQVSATLNPTSAGIVTARLLSNDTNGGGKAFADSLAVT